LEMGSYELFAYARLESRTFLGLQAWATGTPPSDDLFWGLVHHVEKIFILNLIISSLSFKVFKVMSCVCPSCVSCPVYLSCGNEPRASRSLLGKSSATELHPLPHSSFFFFCQHQIKFYLLFFKIKTL
jgi:hypothetical protein